VLSALALRRLWASVLAEAVVLAVTGAFPGAAGAVLLFNGNRNNFGIFVFDLAVTADLVMVGIVWAIIMALLGGLVSRHSSRPTAGRYGPAARLSLSRCASVHFRTVTTALPRRSREFRHKKAIAT
jgi:hypothetical protein